MNTSKINYNNPLKSTRRHEHNTKLDNSEILFGKNKKFATKNNTYYGIELETEIKPIYASTYTKIIELVTSRINKPTFVVLAKRDGSLDLGGIEWVTNPITASGWIYFTRRLRKMCSLIESRCYTSANCGLHIHISRNSFTGREHIVQFAKFFYINRNSLKEIAGRDVYGHHCDFLSLRGIECIDTPSLCDGYTSQEFLDFKYSAVRTTRHTVEARIFGSTLDYKKILAYIQLVDIIKARTAIVPITEKPLFNDTYYWAREKQEKWLKNLWKNGIELMEEVVPKQKTLFTNDAGDTTQCA